MLTQAKPIIAETENKKTHQHIARSLLIDTPVASPEETNDAIFQLFTQNPDLNGLPIVENARPIGLINRNMFMDSIARPFRREIFGRKSCIAFMDKTPLIVEQDTSIQDLSFLVVKAGRKALTDGFVITSGGDYLGMGEGHDLVRAISELQAKKNQLVMESIDYASVIQKSYLHSSKDDMALSLQDYCVHWEPRDIVGGDYYYFSKFDDGFFFAIIDCTGHGVPGAFMTLIVASTLDQVLPHETRHDPAAILSKMNRIIKTSLGQIDKKTETVTRLSIAAEDAVEDQVQSDDGMDAAFCWVNTQTNLMTYAGAKTAIFHIREGDTEISVLDGDRKGVGYANTPMDFSWTNKDVPLEKGTCIYVTTDGIIDQIGGNNNIAFGKRRLKELLFNWHKESMPEQQRKLLESFCAYQGEQHRRDDVTFFGFRY